MAAKIDRLGETRMMNCGMEATIIQYKNAMDIDVRFEDGSVVEHKAYGNFKRGGIVNPNIRAFVKDRLGETRMMNCGMEATIIRYESAKDMDVCFKDGAIVEHRKYDSFKRGEIANPNMKVSAKNRLGETRMMNCGMKATIIRYGNNGDIDVRFEDRTIAKRKGYGDFKKGKIANPNIKTSAENRLGETWMMNCGMEATIIRYGGCNDIDVRFEDGGVRVGWQTIDGKKYYFEDGGVMAIGKYELDGKNYYFFEEGGMATGWNTENDGVRYYSSNGTMVTGFQKIDGEGYFFEEGGLMKTGWYEFKDGKRFFDSTGKMAKGIRKVSGETYYFDKETGYMQTGWIKIDGEKTYFGKNGKIGTGWQKIDGKKYYLDKGGHITTDIANISGKIYFFNKSGAVIFVLPIWIIVILILAGFAGYGFYTTKKDPELKEKIMNKIREISFSVDGQEENKNPTKKADASNIYGDDDDEVIEDE